MTRAAKAKAPKKRDVERSLSREAFVAALRRFADTLESGKPFITQVKGERVRVPASAKVTIEHEREGNEEELEFQVKWTREPAR